MRAGNGSARWWGEFEFELDRVDRWEIGDLALWIHRATAEWRLAHAWAGAGEGEDERKDWSREQVDAIPEEGTSGERYAVRRTGGILRLRARTPDRAVVARPRTPLSVPSGHEARIFVSTPLWLEISVGEAATFLREFPARRLSSTFFGPSTLEGELAYALKTNGRTLAESLPHRPHRFVTPVIIENHASDTLVVERLSLPVPNLSLFDADGSFWSESVRMLRRESGGMAELDLRSGPPPEASGAERVGGPRRPSERGHLFRAFSSIMRLTGEGS